MSYTAKQATDVIAKLDLNEFSSKEVKQELKNREKEKEWHL